MEKVIIIRRNLPQGKYPHQETQSPDTTIEEEEEG